MPGHALEWLELAVRWIHVITGVAWVGTSFYFNWLNDQFREPAEPRQGVSGEVWSIHGGGFYQVLKYDVAPAGLPGTLHWFKWEAYFTWISGFALLALVYYLGADVYLLDAGRAPLGPLAASALGIGLLVVSWVAYDALCKTPAARRPVLFTVLGIASVAATAYGLTHVYSGRGAYIHVGAMLGTWMAANVFFVIIPNQKRMVSAMLRGEEPDANEGLRAAMRSRHNNYLTLPVLFVMVSNHYPLTYQHELNWAALAVLSIAGAAVRHWFNLRNTGHLNRWILPAAAAAMLGLAFVTAPERPSAAVPAAQLEGIDFQTVASLVTRRCAECHSSTPTNPLFTAPPSGLAFETPAEILERADKIHESVVETRFMPPGNVTGMTEGERDLLGRWYRAGAAGP